MNKIKYRILALLLCLTMVFSSFSGTPVDAAMAADAGTESKVAGTEATATEATAALSESEAEGAQDASTVETAKTTPDTTDTAASLSTDAGIESASATDTTETSNTEETANTEEQTQKGADSPEKSETVEQAEEADTPKALTLTKTVEGYHVVLTADAGVLPSDAVLTASLIKSSAATEKIETAIEKEMDADKKLAETIAFDITIYDKDGNEIQPDTTKGNVTVTFQNIETDQTAATETEVFHVQDDYSSADAVSTQTKGDEVAFQAEHFSLYVISVWTGFNDTYYDLTIDTSLKVSDLLTKLGVPFSHVTAATSEDTSFFTVKGSGDDTYIEGINDGIATLNVTYDESSSIAIDVTVTTAAGTCGDNLTWALSGSERNYTLTISGSGAMYDYVSSCEDGTWRSTAPWSKIYDTVVDSAIKALVISEDVTSIGNGAFCGSPLTGALTIPDKVTSIGVNAFGGCSGLTGALTIPSGVISIGANAFSGCSGLTGNLTIPSGVTSIGAGTFSGCTGLTGNLTIPTGVTSIGVGAFFACSGLDGELSIPSGVTSIGNYAFFNCSKLIGNLNIPIGVTSIGECAFSACSGLNKAVIPDSVATIEYGAFEYWKTGSTIYNLSAVTMTAGTHYSGATLGNIYTVTTHVDGVATATKVLGDGVSTFTVADPTKANSEFLGWYTDADFTTKWDSTKAITGNTDLYAQFLTTVYSGNCGAEGYQGYGICGSNLTYKVTTTDDTKYTLTISGSGAMADFEYEVYIPWYSYKSKLTSLVLEEGMTSIGDNAFNGFSNLKGNLTIPTSVTSIGDSAFYSCYGFNGNLTIPSGVTSIGDYAFYACYGLNGNLTIPTGVTSIGNSAFASCTFLTGTLTIPNGVTRIGDSAFNYCESFDKAVIPGSVESIGNKAFFYWKVGSTIYNLSDVTMILDAHYSRATLGNVYTVTTHVNGSVTSSQKVMGDGNSTVSIADPIKENGEFLAWYTDAAFTTKWDSTKAITVNTDLYAQFLTTVDSGNCGAVGDGSNLTYKTTTKDDTNYTLTISGSGAMVDYGYGTAPWYTYKDKLTTLVLEEGMTSIGKFAFYYCHGFKGILTIPAGVTSIGNSAFRSCDGFYGNLTIPTGVTSIGTYAFSRCSNLTGNLTIPSGVKSIGEYAFSECYGFNGSLTIASSVISIGNSAFLLCSGLTGALTIPSSVTSIGGSAFNSCDGLSKIIVPKSVTSIGNYAFLIKPNTFKIYNLSDVTLTEGNHYNSADNLGTVYTVATYIDGIVSSSQKVLGDGEASVTVTDPVKTGYVFLGWYTDPALSSDKLWNGNNQIVSKNLNLYAKLQKVLSVSDISGISNTDAFTYNGSKELPVTLTLSGYDPTGTGTPVSETATATATVSSADAGTYTGYTLSNIVLANGTDSNYTLTGITDGSTTINSTDAVKFGIIIDKAPVTVTAADVTLTVGDSMPELTDSSLTFTGFVNGENKGVLGGTLDFTFSQNHTNSEVSNGTVTPGGYTSNNYAITYVPGKLTVNAKTFGTTPYTASGSNNGKTGAALWYTGDITLTPDSAACGNFKYISISTNGGSTYSDWSTQAVIPSMDGTTPLDTGSGSVVVKLSTADAGTPGTDCAVVTLNDAFTYQLDTTAPKGTITIETNTFESFLNTITFGLLFNKDITVSIAPESSPADLSGTTTYLYKDSTTSTTAKTYAELEALSETSDVTTGWKQTGSFSVTADEQFAVYGKIVDGAGHVTYLNTDGVIVDKTAPVITAISTPLETLMDVTAGAELTADEAGTYYYVVLKSSDTAPATGEEIAQTTAPVSGSGAAVKNIKSAISITGLSPNTTYTLYTTVKDAAGNYSDIKQAAFTTKKTMVTIATAPAITGTYGQQVSGMTLTDGVAKVGETTIPGTWSFAGTYTAIPSVGTQTAYSVLFIPEDTGTYETALVNVIPTITARSLTAAGVTVSDVSSTYTYTGKAVIPGLSVTDTGAAITAADYDITYSNNIGAGENTANVTVTGKGNYTGTVTKTFSIAKADTAITIAPGSESYAKTFGDVAFSLTGITKTGDGTLTYASSNSNVATVSTEGTVTIKGTGTTDITVSLAATDNYNAATDKTITVTVGKAAALSIADITKSYLYTTGMDSESIDLSGLLPNDRGETTYQESVTDTANILSNTPAVSAAGTLTYSVNPGATGDMATINVTVTMANYKDTACKVTIDLTDKTVVDITGITVAGKTYDGEAAAVTGTVSVKKTGTTESVTIDGLAYSYTSTDGKGYDSSTAPTAAGSYQLIISVPDTNKTYKGSSEPISFTIAKKPVFIVTEPAITGTYGQKVCDMTLTDGVVKAGDAQIPGSWSFVSSYTDVPSVDSHTAYSILFTPDDNYMSVTAEVIPTITARSLTAAGVTVSDVSGTYTYTGEAFTPGITVTDTKAAITEADYDITYSNNSRAGENTASVTVTGKGNYTGTVTKTFSIAKADTAITVAAGSESYTKTFKDAAFSLTGITKTGDGTLAYASSKPSVATVSADGTVTIKGAGTTDITVSLPATDNYNAATDKTITVTVGKAAALTIADITKSYLYTTGTDSESIDLSALLPGDRKETTYQIGSVTDTADILNNTPAVSADGILTYSVIPGAIGNTATINVTASMANYKDITLKVVVNLTDKTVVDITGIKVADKTYDGEATTVTGTVSVKKTGTTESVDINGLTYSYMSTDGKGYDSTTAPKDTGSYQLVISVPGSNKTYQGSTEPITFTIAKKTVTVKALDKEIQTGASIPSLTNPVKDTDYTITGLAGSDKLSGTVTLQYAAVPDNTKAGSTAIVIAGVTAGDNYSVSLINGTLTIKQAESSTTTGTDSSTTTSTSTGTTATASTSAATSGSTAARTTASSTAGTNAGNTQANPTKTNADGNTADNSTGATMQAADGTAVTGWEAIATAIQSILEEATNNTADAGESGATGNTDNTDNTGTPVTVAVELNGATTVPKEILEEIKGQNVDLVLSLGNGITWTINGINITGDTLTDIDLNVTKGTDSISADTIGELTDGRSSVQLELAHSGPFGFEATLTINLESENAGLYANLFYYNEETGKFELLGNSEIDEDGNANLTFTHASSYVIVLDTEPMKDTDSSNASSGKAADTVAAEAKDNSLILFIILGIVVAAAVAGGVIYVFYKNKTKKDEDIE